MTARRDPVEPAANPVAVKLEREVPLDVGGDDRAWAQLLLAEAAEGLATRGQPCLLVLPREEPLARPSRREPLFSRPSHHEVNYG